MAINVLRRAGKDEVAAELEKAVSDTPISTTPSSKWYAQGEPDPHAGYYDQERAQLALGYLTDDELANAVFLHGNMTPAIQDVLAGKAKMSIVYQGAAKGRIRWLSRALERAKKDADRLAGLRELMGYIEDGSSDTVRLFQDDATRSFFVKIGSREYYGEGFKGAIDAALARALK
jgi:hypothetical protein